MVNDIKRWMEWGVWNKWNGMVEWTTGMSLCLHVI